MNSQVRWLKEEMEREESELAQAKTDLAEAQGRVEKATIRLQSLKEVLELALERQGSSGEPDQSNSGTRLARGAVSHLSEEAITINGPMSNSELQQYLEYHGHRTSGNSINTSLSRLRGERFDKNKDGKWYLVEKDLD